MSGTVLGGCGNKASSYGAESFLVSTDGGKTFAPRVQAGKKTIAGVSVLSFARSTQNPKTIYIGTRKNGIFVTHDGGQQWQQVTFPPTRVYGLVVDVSDDRVLYASGVRDKIAHIYKSTDGGEQWEKIYAEPTKGSVITALAMDPTNAQILYVGTSEGLILKTTDGGQSWANIFVASHPITDIVFDAQDRHTVYFTLYENGLLKTRDGGGKIEDFTRKVAGTDRTIREIMGRQERRSSRVYSLATDPHTGGVVYVGTDMGVYKSTDYGMIWKSLNVIGSSESLPVKALAINPHNTQELVYSVARTLYRSSKNMTEWTPVQISTSRTASVIRYDPVDVGTIYVGMTSGK